MKSDEMFVGFSVAAGSDRFGEQIKLGGEPVACKVSAQDTKGAMSVFEFTAGWPRHLHHDQDERIYVIDGEWEFEVGYRRFRVGAGKSVFIPRRVSHVWSPVGTQPGKIINVYQPAGKMEEFFREFGNFKDLPSRKQVIKKTYTEKQKNSLAELFGAYGMDLLGPPLLVE
jgi:mannose-6-phosphate isomerase-like protein (cupin superfamily)